MPLLAKLKTLFLLKCMCTGESTEKDVSCRLCSRLLSVLTSGINWRGSLQKED